MQRGFRLESGSLHSGRYLPDSSMTRAVLLRVWIFSRELSFKAMNGIS
ncbi:hypothetical protein FOMG_17974 [Fusarium oxysporum f. sp. melonis 26406]|uniref:Uncharacterized protein n=1 Tax=Fusarium oxysporum f. sp. melonis 26406 TaxID=1089452 RepID=W9Z9Q7_FUSOX|nr:hypothetical protein FOMG_17974 [Fusarium oxysporum f. sp. melonis 26406]